VKPRRVAAPIAALVLAASTPYPADAQELRMPKVELAYDEGTDFSQFKTFRWKDDASYAPTEQAHTRIVWYVERELEKKGLKKSADTKADLLVRYYAKAEESLKGSGSQSESYLPGGTGSLTTTVDFSKVTAASLLVEIQRESDQKTIWRAASGYKTLDTKRVDAETASVICWILPVFRSCTFWSCCCSIRPRS